MQPRSHDPIFVMHQDEGWHLHQPAYCGKVVSTKVGCGRFYGKLSRAVPALAVTRGTDDGTNYKSPARQPNNPQKHLHWCCCFTDMCARHRAGHKSDAGAPPATTIRASVCRVVRTCLSPWTRQLSASRLARRSNEHLFQPRENADHRSSTKSFASAGLWMVATLHFHLS